MRRMVEGHGPIVGRLGRVPLHHPAGGPPPRSGEDRVGHFHARPAIWIAAARSSRPSYSARPVITPSIPSSA
jgi:hypothetical protein